MNIEIHPADWAIPYPDHCQPDDVPSVLIPLTQLDHDWENAPWHLSGSMMELMEKPREEFDYLHLTSFAKARAAMLVLKGKLLDRSGTFQAMSQHRIQIGGIYRYHVMKQVRQYLETRGYSRLPDCEIREVMKIMEVEEIQRRRRLGQELLTLAEREYVNTLIFVSEADEMHEDFGDHSAGFWIKGAEMPQPVPIKARVHRHDAGHDVMPTREEVKRMVRAGKTVRKLEFIRQPGLRIGRGGGKEQGTGNVDGRGKAVVFGDFKVIRIPGAKRDITLGKKHKARSVLRLLHNWAVSRGTKEFYVEEIRDAFNDQFGCDTEFRRWVSDRFREDLFRGKEKDFDLLFEVLDKATGRYRLKVDFLVSGSSRK